MNTLRIQRLGKTIILICLLMMTTSLIYLMVESPPFDSDARIFTTFLLVLNVLYYPMAWLIVSRAPNNIIGWLFIAVIGCFAIQNFSIILNEVFDLLGVWTNLTGNLWVPGLAIPITLMPLYFPDGRLLSPRWRLVLLASILGMLGLMLSISLNGFAPDASSSPWIVWTLRFLPALQAAFLAGVLGSLVSVVLRYRKSTAIVRIQIKWLGYLTAISVFLLLLSVSTGLVEQEIGQIFFFSPPVFIALAIGLAILRYRLYDIDIIIRRTLSYSILTGVLGLLYFGGVALLQSLAGGLFGSGRSPLITVTSTLVIAALFNPLRIRIQDFIDRRFFRRKYDVEKTLSEFAAVARDEVDILRLSKSLLAVIESTMQPEEASLWLRQTSRGGREN